MTVSRLSWCSLLLLSGSMLLACSGQQGPAQGKMLPVEAGRTLVYECGSGGYEFVARTLPGKIALYLPSGYRVLAQQKVASGTRYADVGISLWSKGPEARLELGSTRILSCQLNHSRVPWEEARLRGVDFRAVGQEPGWYLELQHEGQMLFVAQYGSQRAVFETPDPELVDNREIYQVATDGHQIRVEIELHHCTDVMSGEIYDSRVSVQLDTNVYRGCGLALEPW